MNLIDNLLHVRIVIFLGTLTIVSVCAFCWVFFSPRRRAMRVLRKTPRISIAEARDGELVKVVGRLRAVDEPLTSPLTGQPCLFYHVQAQLHGFLTTGNGHNTTTPVDVYNACIRLTIEDDTGSIMVEPVRPVVVFGNNTRQRSGGLLSGANSEVEAFLARYGESSAVRLFNGLLCFNSNVECKHGLIQEGEVAAIHGLCCREPGANTQAGDACRDGSMQLRLLDPPNGRMLISTAGLVPRK